MKIAAIKKLVENNTLEELLEAEQSLLNEETPAIEIEGEDDGEKLTHVFAALEINNYCQTNSCEINEGIRNYTKKVRATLN